MRVLGIDTASTRSSVCIGGADGPLVTASLGRHQQHGEFVTPAVSWCLDRAGLRLDDVDGVAVTVGPGLYTGLRVGLATAQVLAHVRGWPLVGRSSLEVLAQPLAEAPHGHRIWAVLDARRGELFWASYRAGPGGPEPLDTPRVGTIDELAEAVAGTGEPAVCVGDGATRHREDLLARGVHVASPWLAQPSAEALVELSLGAFTRGETTAPAELRPVYLREVDARIGWGQRAALHGGPGEGGPGQGGPGQAASPSTGEGAAS
ncbi:tRNA (adenosine(37)-N6)-threonylcarbamoyltransferase complex dimerization subunit type 1 TsaB [Egibacter rhizosphaerae]|uniref:tRNA (Adenosine(37)-N6)-threonylcarbamoyltransferase complex dimerization subunit type 1 TsaB n=1 Tax=Egibacter rhizosphaerae TaxID=1670831 RepID=A0A411YHM5_9ACTN|nr:tRNA (adenosine(37)-N6)-threonylcarbamoyltransferase complex dimerization subunit type 1 TsaB [Egibacter rhizosphaerae]QBI20582.1 tRNA (adenosine(37)-N6)-threonylcarbamoyltransferase complex dimerization subunit type 1 TsaB [Egibacter rhizosphaerae]